MPFDITPFVDPACTAVIVSECQEAVLGTDSPLLGLKTVAAQSNMAVHIVTLLTVARQCGVKVIHCHVQRREDGFGDPMNTPLAGLMVKSFGAAQGFAAGSRGAQPVAGLIPEAEDIVMTRLHGIAAFHETGLDSFLRNSGIRNIIFTGVSLNVAIFGGTVEAVNRGYRVVIPVDCVAADSVEYGQAVLKNSLRNIAYLTDSATIEKTWLTVSEKLSMKKWLFLLIIGGALWQYRAQLPWNNGSSTAGFFNTDGTSKTLFITSDQCGGPCNQMEAQLKHLGVEFERKSLKLDDSAQIEELHRYTNRVNSLPVLVIGQHTYLSYSAFELPFDVADSLGLDYLPRDQAEIIRKGHFNPDGSKKVVIYGTGWCQYCKKTRELMRQQGVAYEDVDVEKSSENMRHFQTLGGGGYPLVFFGARALSGYDEGRLREMLASK